MEFICHLFLNRCLLHSSGELPEMGKLSAWQRMRTNLSLAIFFMHTSGLASSFVGSCLFVSFIVSAWLVGATFDSFLFDENVMDILVQKSWRF